ncbi:oxidoreductase [Pseudonocardia ailaonensis]|uniref:Oxidoreductase n=1 Tax=Pseudonocardia ailaonensis TaxID=367279 RepID=A0ABN2N585_9PSEU
MTKVFLVTGSSRGLGRHLVQQALADGHSVVATARDPDTLAEIARRHPDRVHVERLDVRDPAAATVAVASATEVFGRLDVLVNNAGQGDLVALEDTDLDAFRRQVDTNFLGTVYVTKAAVPIMRKQGAGHIIQISSIAGRIGSAGLTAYQSAKWAVGGFSTALAAEVEPLGIKVTTIEPGGMRTDLSGASMATPPISEPYRPTVGMWSDLLADADTTANGDPAKVARLVLTVAGLDDPPRRLLAGSDAYEAGRAAWQSQIEEDERWEELSRSTDFAAPK